MNIESDRRLLSVARAARLAGVSRGEIQRRIRSGELRTFEGMVALSNLSSVYPVVALHEDAAVERVRRIQEGAVHKLQRTHALTRDELLGEISRLRTALDDAHRRIESHRETVRLLETRLLELHEQCTQKQRRMLQPVIGWLRTRLRND